MTKMNRLLAISLSTCVRGNVAAGRPIIRRDMVCVEAFTELSPQDVVSIMNVSTSAARSMAAVKNHKIQHFCSALSAACNWERAHLQSLSLAATRCNQAVTHCRVFDHLISDQM